MAAVESNEISEHLQFSMRDLFLCVFVDRKEIFLELVEESDCTVPVRSCTSLVHENIFNLEENIFTSIIFIHCEFFADRNQIETFSTALQ